MMKILDTHLILLLVFLSLIFGLFSLPNCPSEQDERWNITWPTTCVGIIATESCPGGNKTNGSATRECVDGNSWAAPNVSQCRTRELIRLRRQARKLAKNVQSNTNTTARRNMADDPVEILLDITADTRDVINTTIPILPNDIPIILDILKAVLDVTRHGRRMFVMQPQSMDIAENCAMILDIMLDERQDDSFETITVQMQPVSERLLRITERVGILVAITFDTSQNETLNHTFNGSHIIIDALLPSDDDLMNNDNFTFQRRMRGRNNAPLPGIRIPSRVVQNRGMKRGGGGGGGGRRERIPIVNIFILNLESKLQNDEGQETVSAILSTQISNNDTEEDEDGDLDDEEVELMIDIGMLDIESLRTAQCFFWNFSRDGEAGGFSDDGITQGGIIDGSTLSCSSSHLTSFAVLVDTTGPRDTSYSVGSTPALSVVSYVGCGISIVCLSLSIVLFLMFRKKIFNQIRHFIHINLSVALLIGLIVFVSGVEAASNSRTGCLTAAILLHYFFLAAFSWMLCEALVLFIVIKFVFYEGFFNGRNFFSLLGWGLPIPIVAISAAVSHKQYGVDGRCWISEKEGAIWAFLGPMLLIILINSMVYIIIVYQVFKSKHDSITVDKADTVESVKTSLKAAVILLPLLGMTWVFGLLAVNDDTIAFTWIFTILNSLQGFFIFLFYVVKNKKFLSMLKKHSARNYTSKSGIDPSTNKTSTVNSEDNSKIK